MYTVVFAWFNKDFIEMKLNSSWALKKAKYPRSMFSRSEIVWSFLAVINFFSFFILGGIVAYLK